MINNIIKRAEYKLSQHRLMGKQSNLTVLEVAKLMDTIRKGQHMKNLQTKSVFFAYSEN